MKIKIIMKLAVKNQFEILPTKQIGMKPIMMHAPPSPIEVIGVIYNEANTSKKPATTNNKPKRNNPFMSIPHGV